MKFNPNLFTDPIGGLELQFGIPKCFLDFSKEILGLLPGDILGGMSYGILEGRNSAQAALSKITKAIFRDLGIIEYDTVTGKLKFLSETSKWGADGYSGGLLGDVGYFLGQVAGFGGELWENYLVTKDQLDTISNCLGDFRDWLDEGENKSDIKDVEQLTAKLGRFEVYKSQAKSTVDFVEKAENQLRLIDTVLTERVEDPTLEPRFIGEDVDEDLDPIFRLTFGPPKSKKGQFLLSVDGLYYDSQGRDYLGGDIPSAADIGFIANPEKWKLDHAPSLGGRGTQFSLKDLSDYIDTIFDTEHIDNSEVLQKYYDSDHLLNVIIGQRNVHVDSINGHLDDLNTSGYTNESALYYNSLQQLNSVVASYEHKVRKRKKQIEVAVKAPDLFGAVQTYEPGQIPVNDFSYLSGINLSVEIEKQKNLVFDQGEVSGVVLPYKPTYVRAEDSSQNVVILPLNVSPVGTGSMLDGEELEGDAPIISLTSNITTDGLISVYNFTDANYVLPNSGEFKTINCNTLGAYNRSQLVSDLPGVLFGKGLGLPYLMGMVKVNKEDSNSDKSETFSSHPFEVKGVGNYVRLPDTKEFQDLFYNPSGCTIETWTYVPGIDTQTNGFWKHPFDTSSYSFNLSSGASQWTEAHYYRALLACENTGGKNNSIEVSGLVTDRSSDFVRGMVIGFSRDPKMYFDGSVIPPQPHDWDVRQGFGGTVLSVSADNDATFTDTTTSGTWEVSTGADGNFPVALLQASGTFTTANNGTINLSLTYTGDGYQASSHDTIYRINTSVVPDTNAPLSATLNIPYFATGDDYELYMGVPSSVFFIAPTQSYNSSGVGFVRQSDCSDEPSQLRRFKSTLHKSVSGVSLSSIDDEFVHLAIVFDVQKDAIKLYVDSVLYEEGSLSETFGTDKFVPPQIPSFAYPKSKDTSSFYYNSAAMTLAGNAESLFDSGPETNPYFTPWIVGGGWSDGRPISLDTSSGGFMSTGDGVSSAYNGYVGSLKFYCRPLDIVEVTANFDSQKTFFKNIDV